MEERWGILVTAHLLLRAYNSHTRRSRARRPAPAAKPGRKRE